MMDDMYRCFRCGDTGHIKSECPKRTPPAVPPPGAPAPPAPEATCCLKCGSKGEHHPQCGKPPATPDSIATILAAFDLDRSEESSTQFREWAHLGPRREAQLQQMARDQVADARDVRGQEAA